MLSCFILCRFSIRHDFVLYFYYRYETLANLLFRAFGEEKFGELDQLKSSKRYNMEVLVWRITEDSPIFPNFAQNTLGIATARPTGPPCNPAAL